MALLFQRIAHNYAKNGYYPTDSDTTARILTALEASASGDMCLIDPCAGEGVALAECKHHLGQDKTVAYAVEYHQERAYQAKQLLDRCIQGDFQDTVISPRQFGLLWLNPPYGDLVTDKAQTGGLLEESKGTKRLEKLFYQQSSRLLQYGGILVLIVPHYTLDGEFRRWLAAGFDRLSVHLAPEQQFKQAVVIGVRKRTDTSSQAYRLALAALTQFCELDDKPVLPPQWPQALYRVPSSQSSDVRFSYTRLEPKQLADEIAQYPCLWEQWHLQMGQTGQIQRRPLMALSDWHLALVLAAGQVSGLVHSDDGTRTYVVKGDTFKHNKETVQFEEVGDNEVREIITRLDVFVPVIKALDFSPDSPTYGQVLTIR